MKIYWSRESIPELAGLDDKEAMRVWRKSLFKAMRHWQIWIAFIVNGVIVGMPIVLLVINGFNFG